MNLDELIRIWEESHDDVKLTKDYWDLRAHEFNQNKARNYDEIVRFIEEKGILTKDSNILDIGCGPGKLALEVALKSKSVMGIDLSERMIEHARANAIERKIDNARFETLSWEEIDLDQKAWKQNFNLVIATFSPGIHDFETLKKMIDSCKGYCFISSYVQRKDLKNEIDEYLGVKKGEYSKNKLYYIFNILWHLGYFPEISYRDSIIVNEYTYEKALELYTEQYSSVKEMKRLDEFLLKKRNNQGMVKQKTIAKQGWLFFRVKE